MTHVCKHQPGRLRCPTIDSQALSDDSITLQLVAASYPDVAGQPLHCFSVGTIICINSQGKAAKLDMFMQTSLNAFNLSSELYVQEQCSAL